MITNENELEQNFKSCIVAGGDFLYGKYTTDFLPNLIGQESAEDEWSDATYANSQFIKITSYRNFEKEQCVFLVGRIGTGKTAMLNMLKYSIENNTCNSGYKSAVLIDSNITLTYIGNLINSICSVFPQNATYTGIQAHAKTQWKTTIYEVAMKRAYELYKNDPTCGDDCGKIRSYLSEVGLLEASNLRSFFETLQEQLYNTGNAIAGEVAAAISLISKLRMPSYSNAVKGLKSILKNKGEMLILIDSTELYEFNDITAHATLNALMDVCYEQQREKDGIKVKIAIPSEIIPKLQSLNLEKYTSKMVYIAWSQQDLKKLIETRLYKYYHESQDLNCANFETFSSELLKMYPEMYDTPHGFSFNAFAYCLSYTHKKPRQIISIFNKWLSLQQQYPHLTSHDLLESAVSGTEDERIRGALQIYISECTQIVDVFFSTFMGKKYCFSESEFDSWIAKNAYLNRFNIDSFTLKRIFLSSGLVGIKDEMHYFAPGQSINKTGNISRIKGVQFEYQRKESLPYLSNMKYCLHPMCFRRLNIQIDKNTLVYPKPSASDQDYIPW